MANQIGHVIDIKEEGISVIKQLSYTFSITNVSQGHLVSFLSLH